MEELYVEELKMLALHYNKKANDAELKNAELQLLLNRLRTTIQSNTESEQSKVNLLETEILKLESEISKLYEKISLMSIQKPTKKVTKTKEIK